MKHVIDRLFRAETIEGEKFLMIPCADLHRVGFKTGDKLRIIIEHAADQMPFHFWVRQKNGEREIDRSYGTTAEEACTRLKKQLAGTGLQVEERADLIYINKKNYPVFHKVLDMISHDAGAQAGHDTYEIYDVIGDHVVSPMRVELILSRLTPNERETLAIGSEHAASAIKEKMGEDGKYVSDILDVFFHTL